MQFNVQQFVRTNSRSVYSSVHNTFQYSIVSRMYTYTESATRTNKLGNSFRKVIYLNAKSMRLLGRETRLVDLMKCT